MRFSSIVPLLLLAACNGHGGSGDATAPSEAKPRGYAGIGEGDVLRFTGTEPFWGGRVTGGALTYETPEQPEGTAVAVRRFAGNNGLAFAGTLGGGAFDMAVAEAPCSDGMSGRTYPFTVTLKIAGEIRGGCGWTDKRRFTGPEKP